MGTVVIAQEDGHRRMSDIRTLLVLSLLQCVAALLQSSSAASTRSGSEPGPGPGGPHYPPLFWPNPMRPGTFNDGAGPMGFDRSGIFAESELGNLDRKNHPLPAFASPNPYKIWNKDSKKETAPTGFVNRLVGTVKTNMGLGGLH